MAKESYFRFHDGNDMKKNENPILTEDKGLHIWYNEYHGCGWPGIGRRQNLNIHNIDSVVLEYTESTAK